MKRTIAFGLLLAAGRVLIGMNHPPESFDWLQAYKDTAHLFMGGLFIAAWYAQPGSWSSLMFWRIKRLKWQWWLFWLLNVVEVTMAILSRI